MAAVGLSVLFMLVQVAHDTASVSCWCCTGRTAAGFVDLLRLAAISGLGAYVVHNLPTYLAMEPVSDAPPLRIAALLVAALRIAALLVGVLLVGVLLVGVHAGPLVTPWASLTTLLWAASRCPSAGVTVRWRTFAHRGRCSRSSC